MNENNLVESCLKEIIENFRVIENRKYKTKEGNKISYEYRMNIKEIGKLRLALHKLYNKGFEQGVYIATWKGK